MGSNPTPSAILFLRLHLVSEPLLFVYQLCIVRFGEIGFLLHQNHRIARPCAAYIRFGLLLPLSYPRSVMLLTGVPFNVSFS